MAAAFHASFAVWSSKSIEYYVSIALPPYDSDNADGVNSRIGYILSVNIVIPCRCGRCGSVTSSSAGLFDAVTYYAHVIAQCDEQFGSRTIGCKHIDVRT